MIRDQLLQKLYDYTPLASEERVYKQDMITFIKANSNCFERSLESGHITASSWLLNASKTQALLMHHAKLDLWVQLGGHCDGNPDVLFVAIKEAQEESGINSIIPLSEAIFDIDIHFIPATKKEKQHYHYDVRFLLSVTSDETAVQNSESKELKWVDKIRAQLPTDALSIVRMFNKWCSL